MLCKSFLYAKIYDSLKNLYEQILLDKNILPEFKKFNISPEDIYYLFNLSKCHHWFVLLSLFSELLTNKLFWHYYKELNYHCLLKMNKHYNFYYYLINCVLCITKDELLIENIPEKCNCVCTINHLIKKLIEEINANT